MVCMCVQLGEEKVRIERPSGQPVWSLSWNPSRSDLYTSPYTTDFYYNFNGRFAIMTKSLVCVSASAMQSSVKQNRFLFQHNIAH